MLDAPFVGNPAFGFSVSNLPANAIAALLLSPQRVEIPLVPSPGCALFAGLPVASVPFTADAAGTRVFNTPVSNAPSARGLELFFQVVVADSGGAWAGQLSLSNGVHVLVAKTRRERSRR